MWWGDSVVVCVGRWLVGCVCGYVVGRLSFGAVGWLVVVLVVLYRGKLSQGLNFFNFSKGGGGGSENYHTIIAKSCHFYCEIKMEIGITSCYSV